MTKQTLHQKITNQILEAMENTDKFQMPWQSGLELPVNASTNNNYKGINTISLWACSMRKGYQSSEWATYKQWLDLDAQVRKGEHGSTIVIYKPLIGKDGQPICSTEPPYRPKVLISSATVFNSTQVKDWESSNETNEPQVDLTSKINKVDSFISRTGASITACGFQAYYNPKSDLINIPARKLFTGTPSSSPTEAYYSTLLHELVHWSGNEKRCNRDISGHFGNSAYAKEELVAELGSAFLCAELGITATPRQDHASYIKSWIQVLKKDDKAIFCAASKGTDAVKYLNSLQVQINEPVRPSTAIQ